MQAGDLRQKVAFDAPVIASDGHGGVIEGFSDVASEIVCYAHFRFLRGGEAVQAARLQGRQPIVVTVRSNPQTNGIAPDWRMRDVETGVFYNIRSGPVVSDDRAFLEFTCEQGVAI